MRRRVKTPGKRRAERLAAKRTVSPHARGNRIKFRLALKGKAKRYRIGGTAGQPMVGRATKRDETSAHRKVRRRMRREAVKAQR